MDNAVLSTEIFKKLVCVAAELISIYTWEREKNVEKYTKKQVMKEGLLNERNCFLP